MGCSLLLTPLVPTVSLVQGAEEEHSFPLVFLRLFQTLPFSHITSRSGKETSCPLKARGAGFLVERCYLAPFSEGYERIIPFLSFFKIIFFIGVKLLYNVVFVSAVLQSESAVCILRSPIPFPSYTGPHSL